MTPSTIRRRAVAELRTEPEVQGAIELATSLAPTPEGHEYSRRNLLACKAYGAHAGAVAALKRMEGKRYPAWIITAFRKIEERTEPLGAALAEWRKEL